jgi:hypothetical protein
MRAKPRPAAALFNGVRLGVDAVASKFAFTAEQQCSIVAVLQRNNITVNDERYFLIALRDAVREVYDYRSYKSTQPSAEKIRDKLAQFAGHLETALDSIDLDSDDECVHALTRVLEHEHRAPFVWGERELLEGDFAVVKALRDDALKAAWHYKAPQGKGPNPELEAMLVGFVVRALELCGAGEVGRKVLLDDGQYEEKGVLYELVQTVSRFAHLEIPGSKVIRNVLAEHKKQKKNPKPYPLSATLPNHYAGEKALNPAEARNREVLAPWIFAMREHYPPQQGGRSQGKQAKGSAYRALSRACGSSPATIKRLFVHECIRRQRFDMLELEDLQSFLVGSLDSRILAPLSAVEEFRRRAERTYSNDSLYEDLMGAQRTRASG